MSNNIEAQKLWKLHKKSEKLNISELWKPKFNPNISGILKNSFLTLVNKACNNCAKCRKKGGQIGHCLKIDPFQV